MLQGLLTALSIYLIYFLCTGIKSFTKCPSLFFYNINPQVLFFKKSIKKHVVEILKGDLSDAFYFNDLKADTLEYIQHWHISHDDYTSSPTICSYWLIFSAISQALLTNKHDFSDGMIFTPRDSYINCCKKCLDFLHKNGEMTDDEYSEQLEGIGIYIEQSQYNNSLY